MRIAQGMAYLRSQRRYGAGSDTNPQKPGQAASVAEGDLERLSLVSLSLEAQTALPKTIHKLDGSSGTSGGSTDSHGPIENSAPPPIVLLAGELIWQGFGPLGMKSRPTSLNPEAFGSTEVKHSQRYFSLCEFKSLGFARGGYGCFELRQDIRLLDADKITDHGVPGVVEGEDLEAHELDLIGIAIQDGFDGYMRTISLDDQKGTSYHPNNRENSPFIGGLQHAQVNTNDAILCPEVYLVSPQTVLAIGPYSEAVKKLILNNDLDDFEDWGEFRTDLAIAAPKSNVYDRNLLEFLM